METLNKHGFLTNKNIQKSWSYLVGVNENYVETFRTFKCFFHLPAFLHFRRTRLDTQVYELVGILYVYNNNESFL